MADLILLLLVVTISLFLEKKEFSLPCRPLFANICGLVLLCAVPAMLYLAKGQEERYASRSDESRDYFSQEDLEGYCENTQSRFDIIEHPSNNTNYVITGDQNKSTLYSSITNSTYNNLIYDILKMPISIRNRVAMTADENPFQEYLMGVRYIQTKADKVPAGYTVLQEKEGHVLAENEIVLPFAYGSMALMTEDDYDQLSYPENLDTLANRTIVSGASDDTALKSTPYVSQMKNYTLPGDFFSRETSKKNITVEKKLPETLTASTILLISFDVEYDGERDVSIIIDGVRNRLSGSLAPYPNNNHTFSYMLSSDQDRDSLEITFSKGDYEIKNVSAYTIPLSALSHPGVVTFQEHDTAGKQIVNGTITMPEDGYFVTSYTYSNGYKAYVDGTELTPVQVNKAFVGFPLQKGAHEIVLEFHAPGKSLGLIFSCLAALFLILWNLLCLPRHK